MWGSQNSKIILWSVKRMPLNYRNSFCLSEFRVFTIHIINLPANSLSL